ncbi:MAG: PIN domain-containing protein, partial [Gammaproteobacteria bacterium]
MHDPTCIFRFQEHDVFLPMVVLEELDAGKKGLSESARNVRQVSRFLDEMMRDVSKAHIDAGLVISGIHRNAGAAAVAADVAAPVAGRLFFQTEPL